jgi:hypothetical protein
MNGQILHIDPKRKCDAWSRELIDGTLCSKDARNHRSPLVELLSSGSTPYSPEWGVHTGAGVQSNPKSRAFWKWVEGEGCSYLKCAHLNAAYREGSPVKTPCSAVRQRCNSRGSQVFASPTPNFRASSTPELSTPIDNCEATAASLSLCVNGQHCCMTRRRHYFGPTNASLWGHPAGRDPALPGCHMTLILPGQLMSELCHPDRRAWSFHPTRFGQLLHTKRETISNILCASVWAKCRFRHAEGRPILGSSQWADL